MLKLVLRNPITEISGAEMLILALRSPITGVPRAREAAAQTHSCGGISTAEAAAPESQHRERRRGDAKTGPPQSDHGSAACAGGCSTNP